MKDVRLSPPPVPGSVGRQSLFAKFVDGSESYGSHIIKSFIESLNSIEQVVDIGAGSGRDLAIAKEIHVGARTVAIEANRVYAKDIQHKVDKVEILNIERDKLPFKNETQDLIIANQILEHTKEIFWIFHEVTRTLKVGGRFIFGVPNIASLHNRLLLLFGYHPTQHKLYSAHVRPFSKNDTIKFLEISFPEGYHLEAFAGSQFYPLPPSASRIACKIFPEMAFSIYFMICKNKKYIDGFIKHPLNARLETNFWLGANENRDYVN